MKSRLPDLAIDHLSAEQQRILADIRDSRGGDLSGPFLAWIHSPKLAEPAQQLGAFCRYGTCLGSRLTELVILQTAAWWRSQAEWTIHEPLARQAGSHGKELYSDTQAVLVHAAGGHVLDISGQNDAAMSSLYG